MIPPMEIGFGVRRVIQHINRSGMGKVEEVKLLERTQAAMKTFELDARAYGTLLAAERAGDIV